MPTYAYACTACDHRFEVQQSFTDDSLTVCPECEGRLRKVFASVGVVFKGSGFYRNDARAGAVPAGSSSGSGRKTESGSSESASSGSASGSGGSGSSSSSDGGSSTGSSSTSGSTTSGSSPKSTTSAGASSVPAGASAAS